MIKTNTAPDVVCGRGECESRLMFLFKNRMLVLDHQDYPAGFFRISVSEQFYQDMDPYIRFMNNLFLILFFNQKHNAPKKELF